MHLSENKKELKSIWKIFFLVFLFIGIAYLLMSLILFSLYAPLKTKIAGFEFSFSTLNKPFTIVFSLILLSMFFHYLYRRPYGFDKKSVATCIFCIVFLAHLSSPIMFSPDSKWSLPTAKSIIKEGNTDLDEYKVYMEPNDYRIESIEHHLYNIFPLGASIIAIPIVFFTNDEVIEKSYGDIERLIASLVIAMSSIFIFFIVLSISESKKQSILMTFVFAFCTSTWSTASRGLWQHGPTILMLTIVLYLIIQSEKKMGLIQYVSIPLAFSFIVRPTNSLSILLLTIFVFLKYKKYFFKYVMWGMMIAIPFSIYNIIIYKSLLSPYYMPQRIGSFSNFFEGLVGNLISPARGLFVFSPILLFALYGIFLKIKAKDKKPLDLFLLVIILLHWIAISSFPHWWGGHCFGPRFFSDMLPYLIFFMIPSLQQIPHLKVLKKRVFIGISICFISISFFIHLKGTQNFECYEWNASPADVDYATERLWDWHDLQFLR